MWTPDPLGSLASLAPLSPGSAGPAIYNNVPVDPVGEVFKGTGSSFLQRFLGKCFTYGTKTIENLTSFSRKLGDYNGTIISEIDIMKKLIPT